MALLHTHPDRMRFDKGKVGREEYGTELYAEFLSYIRNAYKDRYGRASPRDMPRFYGRKH